MVYSTPQRKTTWYSPSPSATTGMTINPITGYVQTPRLPVNKPGSGGTTSSSSDSSQTSSETSDNNSTNVSTSQTSNSNITYTPEYLYGQARLEDFKKKYIEKYGFAEQENAIRTAEATIRRIESGEITSATKPFGYGFSPLDQALTKDNVSDFKAQLERLKAQRKGAMSGGGSSGPSNSGGSASTEIPIQKGPELVYGPAPGLMQQYKDVIANEGYFGGTISFIGYKTAGLFDQVLNEGNIGIYKFKGANSYQQEGIRNLGQFTGETALVTIPGIQYIGAGLMTGRGVESVATSSGRERLNIQVENLINEGNSKTYSRFVVGSGPVLDVAFGGAILSSGLKESVNAARLRNIERTPLVLDSERSVRIESQTKGFDILYGSKKVGKETFNVELQHSFLKIMDSEGNLNKVIYENGKGIVSRSRGNKVEGILFESGGNINIQSNARIIKEGIDYPILDKGPYKNTLDLKDFQSASGTIFVKPLKEGSISVEKYLKFPSPKYKVNFITEFKGPENPEIKFGKFGGIGKEVSENEILFASGKTKSLRYYPIEDKITSIQNIENIGKIRRIEINEKDLNPNTESSIDSGYKWIKKLDSGNLKTSQVQKTSPASASYINEVLEKSINLFEKPVQKTSSKIRPSMKSELKSMGLSDLETPKAKQKSNLSSGQRSNDLSLSRNFDALISGQNSRQKQRNEYKTSLKSEQVLKNDLMQRESLDSSLASKLRFNTKQQFKTTPKNPSPMIDIGFPNFPKPSKKIVPFVPFDLDNQLKKESRSKKRSRSNDRLILTSDFIGKTFGIRRKVKRKDLYRKARGQEFDIGIAGIPELID